MGNPQISERTAAALVCLAGRYNFLSILFHQKSTRRAPVREKQRKTKNLSNFTAMCDFFTALECEAALPCGETNYQNVLSLLKACSSLHCSLRTGTQDVLSYHSFAKMCWCRLHHSPKTSHKVCSSSLAIYINKC